MSSNFDRFKRLKAGGEPEKPYTNPYAKSAAKATMDKQDDDSGPVKSILDGQNKHLYSLVNTLQREVKELREDIASLYSMLMSDDENQMTPQEAREMYMLFKTDLRHLINRKLKEHGTTNQE